MDLRAIKLKLQIRLRRATNALAGFLAIHTLRAARLVPLSLPAQQVAATAWPFAILKRFKPE